MSRKTKIDWFTASINLLNHQGPQSLTIDALSKSVGVTKGSFYHHFGSLAQFKQALLAYFESAGTLQIIQQTELEGTASAKLHRLVEIVSLEITNAPSYIETGLRAWAQQDEDVAHLIAKIDAQRIGYVKQLLTDIFKDETKAQLLAEIFYAVLVGSEHIIPPLAQTRLAAYLNELLRLYGVENE